MKTASKEIARRIAGQVDEHEVRVDEDRLPMLVTGVSGVTGFNAFYHFRQRYPGKVIGQRPVNNWPLHDEGLVPFNLEDRESVKRVIDDFNIRSVLNCGGNCALKSCELDPAMAKIANVDSVNALLDALDPAVRLVHLSIDLVFSGIKGEPYLETDPPDPVTEYGKTMAEGESRVQLKKPNACILRISLPMGVSFNGHAGAIDWIQSRFAAGKPATLYYDEVRTPAYVQSLNSLFAAMLNNNVSGIFHAPGRRPISLYQIAQVINLVGGFDPRLLIGCYRIEAGPIPPRAGNVVMNGQKLTQLLPFHQLAAWPCEKTHVPTDRVWHYQRDEVNGSPNKIIDFLYRLTK